MGWTDSHLHAFSFPNQSAEQGKTYPLQRGKEPKDYLGCIGFPTSSFVIALFGALGGQKRGIQQRGAFYGFTKNSSVPTTHVDGS